MEISKVIGGFTPAQADDLRKAIGKKIKEKMDLLEPKFREGAAAYGTASRIIDHLWSLMEKASDYSFNKSHAACYALISYRTAYLKANYPVQYMAALISSVMDTKDKVPFYVQVANDMGIEVLPPDINESVVDFRVVEGRIRFGLNAVKNVGETAIRSILDAREREGPFTGTLRLLRAGRPGDGQSAGRGEPGEVWGHGLHRPITPGHAPSAPPGHGSRQEDQGRRRPGPGLHLRPVLRS